MTTATIIGSGPNGLSAEIVLASAGISTTVVERSLRIGGACSTAETTLPGYRHDLGSSVYPLGVASPFFRSLPIDIPWIEPSAPCAHPLDDGTAVLLEHSIKDTGEPRFLRQPQVSLAARATRRPFLGAVPRPPWTYSAPPTTSASARTFWTVRSPTGSIARTFPFFWRSSTRIVRRNGRSFDPAAGGTGLRRNRSCSDGCRTLQRLAYHPGGCSDTHGCSYSAS